jgi:23S rRNA pseudouridine2605 synthase
VTGETESGSQRLQKIIAAAGIASRRKAEELIAAGRVQVNGQVVTELGAKADPARDHIRVDGKLLQGAERPRYFVLNKPRGYVTTASDPEGRPGSRARAAPPRRDDRPRDPNRPPRRASP